MNIAIIGDYNIHTRSHAATDAALSHSADWLGLSINYDWIPTNNIHTNFDEIVNKYNSFWIAPGGPFNNMNAVIDIIKYARENNKPTIGTCGGFQLMVIEYARNVLHIKNAEHAEYNPDTITPVISPLTCNIKGSPLEINLIDDDLLVSKIYKSKTIVENYYCSYGINSDFQKIINDSGFCIVGTDETREARILELKDHPFYIATLFVPQVNSSKESPNQLITAFLKADQ